MGKREDFPNILLNNAFTPDCSNVQLWNGEIRTAKLRKIELLRTVYAVSSLSTTGETIKISGNHITEFPSGATVTLYNASDSSYEQFTLSTTSTAVSGDTLLTVTGDLTASTPNEYVFNDDGVSSNDPSNVLFRSVATPDAKEIILYKQLMLSSDTERLVAFTSDHIYFWDSSLTKWQLIFTCASACTLWSADQYGDNVVATNDSDRPIYWDGDSSTTFQNIDTQLTATTSNYIAKAKFIKSFRNYIFLGNIELSSGTRYGHHIYWCNVGEGVAAGGWRNDASKDSGNAYIEGAGEITGGFGLWQGYLIVFKRWSTRKLWYTAATIPFEQDSLYDAVGSIAPNSILNDKTGRLYFYGSDKAFREVSLGKISQPMDVTIRDINPSLVSKICSLYVEEYGEIWWGVPYGNSASANNKIVIYKNGKWQVRDIPIVALGKYSRGTSYTWDTLPFSTWDSWTLASWDAIDISGDFSIDLCSDSSGNTYEVHGAYTDIGVAYTSYFVLSTDLAQKSGLMFFKRLLQIFAYIRKTGSGTLTLFIKRDNETDWQSLGTVSMSGDEDILRQRLAVDQRARHYLIKVSSTSKFNFLGMEFEHLLSGAR